MSRQRSAVGQNQNPFGLTGSGSSSPSSSSAFKRITAELAQIWKDQHRLFASVQNVVSNQQTGQSAGTASRASDIPPGVIFTATGGPAVPPKGVKHNHSLILRNARSLVTEKMGDRGKRPYEYDYPKTVSAWPLRVIAGRDGDPDREVRLLRLNWAKSYMSEEVQSQLRCIFDYLLTHRRAHGVPAHMTREHLVSLFRNTYEYWQRQHRLRRTAQGRSRTAQEKARSKLLSRRRAKLSARTEALGIPELVRYADGTTLSRKGKANEAKVAARGLDMRADIEFAVQMAVHSPEEVEMESHNNGERMVVRPMFLEWRSLELLDTVKYMDDNRKRLRPHPVRSCLHVFRQSSNFRLPSTVRRWMVSSEYASQHPDVCVNVSDNAGPFDLETSNFAMIESPTTWGCPIPVNRRPPTRSNGEYFGPGDAAGSDGEGDARDGEVGGGDSRGADAGVEDVEPWDDDDFDNDDFGEGGEGGGEGEDLFGEGRVDDSDDDDSDGEDGGDDSDGDVLDDDGDGGDDGYGEYAGLGYHDDGDGGDDDYGAYAGLGYRGRVGSVEGVSGFDLDDI